MNGLVKSRRLWQADFETTTDPEDCRVWLWGLCDIDTEEIIWGIDILSFFRTISKDSSYIWFHNLAFDGSFIIDWLLKNEYEHVTESPRSGEFSTLISLMGKFYSIKVGWNNGEVTEFRDSLKKIPLAVRDISKAFNIEETKGKIDYDAYRPIGYMPDDNEIEYLKNDILIPARAIKNQIRAGLTSLTVGADALREYKELMSSHLFDRFYPKLDLDMDKEIRKAYRGGFTYADPRYSKQILGAGKVFDVNSLYPSVMYNRMLPFGMPVWKDGAPFNIPSRPLWIASLTITARLKPHHIPCIQIKGNSIFSSTEYQREIIEPTTIACSNVDWDLWNDHYDIQVESYNGTFFFEAQTGLFTDYIDKWSAIKENSVGGMRTIAKLQLNSLYGKFATNPNVTPKIPILEDGVVKLVVGEDESRDPVYTAMGVFITSYARDFTIRAAQSHYSRFAYADTDSLHLLDLDPVNLDIHPTKLGYWKHEYDFKEAYFMRAKAYTERHTDDRLETHIAGLPLEASKQVTFEHYKTGHTFGGKLSPKRVSGGIVLTDVGFTLKG